MMWTQAKEPQGPPDAERSKKDPPLEASEGAGPCPHFGFRLLASRTVKEHLSVLVSHLACVCETASGHLYRSHHQCLEEPHSDIPQTKTHPFDVPVALFEGAPD